MDRFMNLMALILWVAVLILGITKFVAGESIHAITFIFPVLGCIAHYIGELM